jgi:integrase
VGALRWERATPGGPISGDERAELARLRRRVAELDAEKESVREVAVFRHRLETSFRVTLATGLRRGEALALYWSDVDIDAGLLRVRWIFSRTSKGCISTSPGPRSSP